MCAFINVKKYNGKGFKCPVEDKHKYHNYTLDDKELKSSSMNGGDGSGCTFSDYTFAFDYLSDKFKLAMGYTDDSRIGNKVFLKFADLTYSINLSFDSSLTLPDYKMCDFWGRFRVMVVKFDQAMTDTLIKDWLRNTFVYITSNSTYNLQSCHQSKMRESTEWTGRFKILYDEKFKIDKKNSVKFDTIHIPFSKNITFTSSSSTAPKDYDINYIYAIYIPPAWIKIDWDYETAKMFANTSASTKYKIANVNSCLKFEYYDM